MTGTTTAAPAAAFAGVLDAVAAAPEFLQSIRTEGHERFAALGLPDRQQEAWRFTRLAALEGASLLPPSRPAPVVEIAPWVIPEAHLLVFVDGIFAPVLSTREPAPEGVVVTTLAAAAASGATVLETHLGRLAPVGEHPFAALNAAVVDDGALVRIADDAEVTRPIQILFVSGAEDNPTLGAPRALIVAGASSKATVVTNYLGAGGASLSCPVTEIYLDRGANLEHVSVQEESVIASHMAVLEVRLAGNSRYAAHAISLGGNLARTDIGVILEGEGAEATLDGLYLTDGSQQADTHITVRHAHPNCSSHQLFKGILAGSSRAVFNGRIVVDEGAQKTDARQSNRNLLLSEDAVVNSNPQLEIFADDVRCTHGSTIGRLDEEAIFYLRSRGIDRKAAKHLLTLAFAGEVLDRIPVESVRARLEERIRARLPEAATSRNPA
ncbi:MAG: Fe-S cluster assembly protein SufD [Thermoanaerobaculales bacterium]